MRPLSFAVVLALLVSQSGCTLAFGVYGVGRDTGKRRAERRAFTLADPPPGGARVLVDLKNGRHVEGLFDGFARAKGDTTRTLVVVRTVHARAPVRLRASDVRRMWVLPKVRSARNGLLLGLALDATLVAAYVFYAMSLPCTSNDSCPE